MKIEPVLVDLRTAPGEPSIFTVEQPPFKNIGFSVIFISYLKLVAKLRACLYIVEAKSGKTIY